MKDKVPEIVKKSNRELPSFSDGRINYSNAEKVPTVITFVRYEDEILIMKRSDEVSNYKNKWCVVAGYLDELKPVEEKALDEVLEETRIEEEKIVTIKSGGSYEFEGVSKTWVPHPILVELAEKPDIELDWEHTDYKWVKEEEVDKFLSFHFLEGLNKLKSQ